MSSDSRQRSLVDKIAVARSFNAAAENYEQAAALQQEVERRMLARLDLMKINPQWVVDVGAGPGRAVVALSKRYRRARVVAIDIAPNMLRLAKRRAPRWFSRQTFVCADAEVLPLANNSTDLLFTNLTLQWCNDLDAVCAEFSRVLKPGGLLMMSTLGPDTLKELRDSWSVADGEQHVNDFIDMHDIGDALMRAGLANPVMDVEHFTLTFDSVGAIMRELKMLGAHNVLHNRNHSLTGKGKLAIMAEAYEKYRTDDRLPLTYEIVYGHAWKGQERNTGIEIQVIKADTR